MKRMAGPGTEASSGRLPCQIRILRGTAVSIPRFRRPSWSRAAGACSLILLVSMPVIAGNGYAVRNGTIAGGGGTVEAGPYRLIGTAAEPVQGPVSSGPYRLTAGYPATIGDPQPVEPFIFRDGFED